MDYWAAELIVIVLNMYILDILILNKITTNEH